MPFGTLKILTPGGQINEFALEKQEICIGRGKDNDLIIEHLTISRHHARIRVEVDGVFLTDLGSANGSFIGGKALLPNTPQRMDVEPPIRLGQVPLEYIPPTPDAINLEDLPTLEVPKTPPPVVKETPHGPSLAAKTAPAGKADLALEVSKIVLPVVATILTACLSGIFLLITNSNVLPHLFGAKTPTVISTPPPVVLFKDDFSDPASGWDRYENEEYRSDYEKGAYVIEVLNSEGGSIYWGNRALTFNDFRLEVDATKAAGSDDNEFGVLARYVGSGSYYLFMVSSDGYYGIFKKSKGETTTLSRGKTEDAEILHQGAATNHIRVDCIGKKLTLYLNGHKVSEVEDTAYASGDIGLYGGTTTGVKIQFKNLAVYKP